MTVWPTCCPATLKKETLTLEEAVRSVLYYDQANHLVCQKLHPLREPVGSMTTVEGQDDVTGLSHLQPTHQPVQIGLTKLYGQRSIKRMTGSARPDTLRQNLAQSI